MNDWVDGDNHAMIDRMIESMTLQPDAMSFVFNEFHMLGYYEN